MRYQLGNRTNYVDGSVVLISPIYFADNDRWLVCYIHNADRNQTILPQLILMWTNERQHCQDEKAKNCHFGIDLCPNMPGSSCVWQSFKLRLFSITIAILIVALSTGIIKSWEY
jgi:hypothetical protein